VFLIGVPGAAVVFAACDGRTSTARGEQGRCTAVLREHGQQQGRMTSMAETILVAYATRYGSTQEVADAVAGAMREQGATVEVRPAGEVKSLSGYVAVVVGTPLYIGSMLKDARRFLERNREELQRTPVAAFALGPLQTSDDLAEAGRQFDAALSKIPWFKPVATSVFVGVFDPTKLRFPDSLLKTLPASPLHDLGALDERDWDAIRAWARELPSVLGVAGVAPDGTAPPLL
jgi:menaquinone-dependent protoporphyrinogen oxidase